jgi:hypothetical protein
MPETSGGEERTEFTWQNRRKKLRRVHVGDVGDALEKGVKQRRGAVRA